MYNRQFGQRKPPAIPQNYSGNAFYRVPPGEQSGSDLSEELPQLPLTLPPPREPLCEPPSSFEPPRCEKCESSCEECKPSCDSETCDKSKSAFPFFGGKLFPRGVGSEELLILALILMTSQSGDDNYILLCLILLLFC